MRTRLVWRTLFAAVFLLVLAGCGGAGEGQGGGSSEGALSGQIVLYTSEPQENADETVAAFNEQYPEIEVQVFRSGTGELLTRIEAEEAAGGVQADVLLAADAPTFENLKSRDLFVEYTPAGAEELAEEFKDPDGFYTGTRLISTIIGYNTDQVQEPPRSWQDAGFILVFVSNLSDFGIPALLGLPERYEVLPTLIYGYLVSGSTDDPLGAASSIGVVLLLLAGGALILQRKLSRRLDSDAPGPDPEPVALGPARVPFAALLSALVLVITVAPVAALLVGALLRAPGVPLTPENLSLANLERAIVAPATIRGATNSLLLASGAALVCGLLGATVATLIVRARSRLGGLLDALTLGPQALPGTVIAVAWILAAIPIGLYGTKAVILFAYTTAFVALVVQTVRGALANVPVAYEEAARLSGASPLRALRDVTWPLVSPAILVGAALVFFTAVRELTISALLVAPGSETLGVVIFNLQQAGTYNVSTAFALVVAVASLLGVGAIALLNRGRRNLWRALS